MDSTHKYSMANYGKPVTGERLIGRKEQIKQIERRIIDGPGNLALIGLPGIGKSSIILESLWKQREALFIKNHLLIIRTNLALYTYDSAFFRQLLTSCKRELAARNLLTTDMEIAARDMLSNGFWAESNRMSFESFFEAVHEQGISTLFILENFDFVDELFKNDIGNFDFLRELATHPDYGVTLVTLSQCLLNELGPRTQNRAISRFERSFSLCFVSMFNDDEMQIYFERLASFGLTITDTVKDYIESRYGRHPYLLEMFGDTIDGLAQDRHGAEPDIYMATRKIEASIIAYISDLIQQLQRRGVFNNLIQLVSGSTSRVKETEIQDLRNYGLIKPAPEARETGTPEYVAFCTYLQKFLVASKQDPLNAHYMELLEQTENTLRNASEAIFRRAYGESWINIFAGDYSNFSSEKDKNRQNMFRRCREARDNDMRSDSAKPSENLLSYTTMDELCKLILQEWKHFESYLDGDGRGWETRFTCIRKVRNLIYHGRFKDVYSSELEKTEEYCREILARLHFE